MTKGIALLLCLLLLGTLLSACAPEPTPEAPRTPIRIVANSWLASELNATVAKIMLEEELGYPVEIVYLDEEDQWEALANGDAHVNLEVWQTGRSEDVAYYIEAQGLVEQGGNLGPVGKIGWFIPAYMRAEHPELSTWEGFADPELARLFATEETGDRGQFLAGDPSWVQFEEQIIENLELPLQVVCANSEVAILEALATAYANQDPLLFYFWSPHWAFAQYDLIEVRLPPYSPECYARQATGGVDCDYPAEQLFKIFWPGLREYAPEAYEFLQNFYYTNSDQIEMLAPVEIDGLTVEEAARAWIQNHPGLAQAWLP